MQADTKTASRLPSTSRAQSGGLVAPNSGHPPLPTHCCYDRRLRGKVKAANSNPDPPGPGTTVTVTGTSIRGQYS